MPDWIVERVLERDARGGYVVISAHTVHSYECPAWRMGTRHGPCRCGADEAWARQRDTARALVEANA